MVAQVAALDHPDAFSALTLVGTRPVAPGPIDADLPDHDEPTMRQAFARSPPDWVDRAAVADHAAAGAEILGDDPEAARTVAGRIWDRTPSTAPAIQAANQQAMVFARLNCRPRWRERLPQIAIPTLVVHGRENLVVARDERTPFASRAMSVVSPAPGTTVDLDTAVADSQA